jgi:DNA-binding GntR family transcriptional regulator
MASNPENESSSQQIYGRVKIAIINRGFYPGERINIERCAEKLRVSTTPVREALNRLVAENLVDLVPQMGFFMKRISEADMRDLLEFNALLVNWSLADFQRQYPDCSLSLVPPLPSELKDIANCEATNVNQWAVLSGIFFLHIAKLSGNQEIIGRVASCNDRLQSARTCEFAQNSMAKDHVIKLCDLFVAGDFPSLQESLNHYFELRQNQVRKLVRLLESVSVLDAQSKALTF